jgi:twitching motility protein PilT
MNVDALISAAREQGASDLHLEPGLPAAIRIRGTLRTTGEPLPARTLLDAARDLIGHDQWPRFLERRSFDFSRTISGVRCRINIFQTSRGVGMAIRLLASFQATIEKLNLHPDLRKLINHTTGLILISGSTGSGKSSTLAALIQEINLSESRHVLTIESPIEYTFRPRQAYIRQREVGRDTPSFEQALLDALREDPDVLMVGEMRDPETMRLTLNAAETGHLVLATVHSSTCAEALQRIVSAFPAEVQSGVRAQLADCLVGVVCQRLRFRQDLKIRVPECEILVSTMAVKNFIRTGDFYKLISQMEMGADHGMFSFARYQNWLENKKVWHFADPHEKPDNDIAEAVAMPPPVPAPVAGHVMRNVPPTEHRPPAPSPGIAVGKPGGPIEIEPVEGGLEEVIRKLEGER